MPGYGALPGKKKGEILFLGHQTGKFAKRRRGNEECLPSDSLNTNATRGFCELNMKQVAGSTPGGHEGRGSECLTDASGPVQQAAVDPKTEISRTAAPNTKAVGLRDHKVVVGARAPVVRVAEVDRRWARMEGRQRGQTSCC